MTITPLALLTDPAPELRDVTSACRDLLADLATTERVRACADGHDAALWSAVVEAGWPGLGLPEDLGGAGFGPQAQLSVLEEAGRALAPAPLLAVALALPFLVAAGADCLPEVAAGDRIATLVVDREVGGLGTAELTAARDGDAVVLDGRAGCVLDGHVADLLVVVLPAEGGGATVAVVERGAAGLELSAVRTVDVTRGLAEATFGSCRAVATEIDAAALDAALATASAALAAEMVGTAAQALDLTLLYLKTRHQFGVPIGSFQALKHRCADLAADVTLSRELVHAAGASADRTTATAALVRTARALQRVSGESVQLHGGIGFTEEHDIGLYHRRALVDVALLPAAVVTETELADLLDG